uniref:Transposase (Putative), gypsy type n=1 Tax=Tanacetum cinerariifolium TaxID=118510 RepID=A0A699GXL6_TANCI|nr:hypothetical protein [Tanacetum cinerariifolium]
MSVIVGCGPILAKKLIIVCGSGRPILYVIMSPQSRRHGRGRNRGHDTYTSINPVFNRILESIQSVIQPNIRANLSRDGENNQMMGRVRPTTASSTPEILTIQYVSGDTDTVQLETAVTTISQEYLLEFTSEYGILEALHPKLPGPEDRIVDFPEGKAWPRVDVFQQEAREKYPSMLYQALRFSKRLEQPLLLGGREGVPDYCGLAYKCFEGWDASREYVFPRGCDDTEHTSYPNLETTRSTTLLSRVELQILPGRRDMDLFSLIRAPNPTKVKTGSRPRGAHEVPLLTITANRVIEMEDPTAATDSSEVPSTIERSPLDFANENPSQQSTGPEDQEAAALEVPPPENVTTTGVAPEAGQAERVSATGPPVVKKRRKRGHDGVDTNAPPKVPRGDHADPRRTESTRGGKSLAAIELGMGSTRPVHASKGALVDVSDPNPISFADPQSRPSADVTQSFKGATAAGDPESENTSFTSMVRSSESIYRPEWGITNGCLLDAPEACQDLVDHIAPQGYFLELRHLHNDGFLKQYNVNLARQLAMGSQLQLRFEQEAQLLKKSVAQVARRDKRIQARENEIKNLETPLEAETDMKKAAENKTIAGRRWVIGRGLRLAVMKCGESIELRQAFVDVVSAGIAKGMSEGLKHGVEHGKAKLDLEAIEAYDRKPRLNILRPFARDLMDPWACKEEILLADAIAANISRAEKKKKCRVVCRTHEVGSAHHARSDGVPVSVPTVSPQGLAILLADAATQTEISEDEASPRLLRSSSLPAMHS